MWCRVVPRSRSARVRQPIRLDQGDLMPTPGGLPKPGEIWRRTQTLPKAGTGGREWETTTVDVEIIERGSGQMWSVQVRLPDGQVKLWTEMSYDWSRGNFTFLHSAKSAR